MSTLDGDMQDHEDMDFVRDLMDKFQAVEDAAHRLAVRAALATMVPLDNLGEYREVALRNMWHPENQAAFDDAMVFLTGRCGATFDESTRILRMPKE